MTKAALLLLTLAVLAGMIGKLLRPRSAGAKARPIEAAEKCRVCDAYVLGGVAASCARPDCPKA